MKRQEKGEKNKKRIYRQVRMRSKPLLLSEYKMHSKAQRALYLHSHFDLWEYYQGFQIQATQEEHSWLLVVTSFLQQHHYTECKSIIQSYKRAGKQGQFKFRGHYKRKAYMWLLSVKYECGNISRSQKVTGRKHSNYLKSYNKIHDIMTGNSSLQI